MSIARFADTEGTFPTSLREMTKLRDELEVAAIEYAEADRRRDLVPYDEVLREFGPEIADREARPPRGIA